MNNACQLIEFKTVEFRRDNDYFDDGYASWEVIVKHKTYYVHAIYQKQALEKNEFTKDYSNGIKAFEIQNMYYKTIKTLKRTPKEKASSQVDLKDVEEFLLGLN